MNNFIRLIESFLKWDDERRKKRCVDRCVEILHDPETGRKRFMDILQTVFFTEDAERLADEFVDLHAKIQEASDPA